MVIVECPGERQALAPDGTYAEEVPPQAMPTPAEETELAEPLAAERTRPGSPPEMAAPSPPTETETVPLRREELPAGQVEHWEEAEGDSTLQDREPPRRDLDDLRESLGQGADRIRQSTEDLLLRVLPERLPERPPAQAGRSQGISLSGRALVAVALAIPLVMLFMVVMTRIQYERTRQEQFSSLQALAQSRYDMAAKMTGEVELRQGLYDALATVEEGLAVNPGDETLDVLKLRILHRLDEVDVVERLYHLWKLVELEDDVVSATDSSRIVVRGIDVFVLNRGSGRVYKFLLNEVGDALQSVDANPILVQKGEIRGGVQLGDMVDIAWMEAGGQRTLSTFVILERAGSLLAYDPQQGIDVMPVADSDIWLKPQAIAGYFGNLYVLDPLLGRILKHVPTDNAYTNPPSDYLGLELGVDLTGAVDMAVDGTLYVLFADGQIRKFYRGQRQPFDMEGLPRPMRSPTTIFVSGPQEAEAGGYVYVTDTGNERVVQFDKQGQYVRQFRANPGEPHMEKLRGIYVDEEMGRMLILSGKTLWLAQLPSLEGESSS